MAVPVATGPGLAADWTRGIQGAPRGVREPGKDPRQSTGSASTGSPSCTEPSQYMLGWRRGDKKVRDLGPAMSWAVLTGKSGLG